MREFGVSDGPILVFGLYLALSETNSMYVDVIEEQSSEHDSRDVILRPQVTSAPSPRPFAEVSKKALIGNSLLLGLETYFKIIIESVKSQLKKLSNS